MASFVLVHGAWHGGWCWEKVVPALEAAGHVAVAPDLPGHGSDPTPHDRVDLQAYCDRVCEQIDCLDGAVVLVGHSLGGLTISQVAEHRHDRLRCLVYLAAFVPGSSGSVAAATDSVSPEIHTAVRLSDDGHSIGFDPAMAREIFYADCSEGDAAGAIDRLCPQPGRVFRSGLQLSQAGYGQVPRDYILCLQDRAVPIETQRSLADRHCRHVYSMDRSHSPFFSAPNELAKILGEIADA